jgi:sigma-B regulation protein RsbQ
VLVEWVETDMASAPPGIARDALRHAFTNEGPAIAALPRLGAPFVAINPDDPPTDVESMRRHGIRTVTTTGVGHFPMLDDPAQFNRLLEEVLASFGAPG